MTGDMVRPKKEPGGTGHRVSDVIRILQDANLPENATMRGYEGEACGIIVEVPERHSGLRREVIVLHNDGRVEFCRHARP